MDEHLVAGFAFRRGEHDTVRICHMLLLNPNITEPLVAMPALQAQLRPVNLFHVCFHLHIRGEVLEAVRADE